MSSIEFKSLYANIIAFMEGKDIFELIDLHEYISSTFINTPAKGIQVDFVKEFFGELDWAEYVQSRQKSESMFKRLPPAEFENIQAILAFETLKKAKNVIRGFQLLQDDLSNDLNDALDRGVIDGVFSKVDGFSELYETLIKHELIEERED